MALVFIFLEGLGKLCDEILGSDLTLTSVQFLAYVFCGGCVLWQQH